MTARADFWHLHSVTTRWDDTGALRQQRLLAVAPSADDLAAILRASL